MGLSRTLQSLRSASGTAQHLMLGIWGVIVAGMLWGYAPEYLYNELLLVWGGVSVTILALTIWGSKQFLQYALMLDMVLSVVVLALYSTYDPQFATEIIYRVDASGHIGGKHTHDVACHFTQVALLFMAVHATYLANLTQRQILESRRFR